jgi:phosphoglycolate/pyridoxal phosphate phosphatase family enzyme
VPFDAFIFDLDGVIWRGHSAIPGAAEGVSRLRAAGRRTFFCTNNSSLSRSDFVCRLRAIDVPCEADDIFTSAHATALYLKREMPPGFSAYVVGGPGLINALQGIGAQIHTGDDESPVDVVVAGIDRQFSYDKLRIAQAHLLRGAKLSATNRDATFPVEGGIVPGAGSIIAAIQTASSIVPLTIGKPEPLMLRLIVDSFGLDASRTVMVGDRLDTDIACAHRAGLQGWLVETGVHSRQQGEAASGDERPDAIFHNLPALCEAVL